MYRIKNFLNFNTQFVHIKKGQTLLYFNNCDYRKTKILPAYSYNVWSFLAWMDKDNRNIEENNIFKISMSRNIGLIFFFFFSILQNAGIYQKKMVYAFDKIGIQNVTLIILFYLGVSLIVGQFFTGLNVCVPNFLCTFILTLLLF